MNIGGVISPRPKITCYSPDEIKDALLIQCCDGVFDIASSSQVAQFVTAAKAESPSCTSKDLAADIVDASFHTGSKDNLTALVIPVNSMVDATRIH